MAEPLHNTAPTCCELVFSALIAASRDSSLRFPIPQGKHPGKHPMGAFLWPPNHLQIPPRCIGARPRALPCSPVLHSARRVARLVLLLTWSRQVRALCADCTSRSLRPCLVICLSLLVRCLITSTSRVRGCPSRRVRRSSAGIAAAAPASPRLGPSLAPACTCPRPLPPAQPLSSSHSHTDSSICVR